MDATVSPSNSKIDEEFHAVGEHIATVRAPDAVVAALVGCAQEAAGTAARIGWGRYGNAAVIMAIGDYEAVRRWFTEHDITIEVIAAKQKLNTSDRRLAAYFEDTKQLLEGVAHWPSWKLTEFQSKRRHRSRE